MWCSHIIVQCVLCSFSQVCHISYVDSCLGFISTARLITGSTLWSYHAGTMRTPLATHPRACQVQSRCPGMCLSTWQMIAALCPTALGALCGQLTFRLVWCCEHSAVTATELLQPLDLACGTLFLPSCAIQTSPTYCSDNSWKNILLGAWTWHSVTSDKHIDYFLQRICTLQPLHSMAVLYHINTSVIQQKSFLCHLSHLSNCHWFFIYLSRANWCDTRITQCLFVFYSHRELPWRKS